MVAVGQHPLSRQAPLGEQEGSAIVFCGPQLDSAAGLGWPVALRLGAGQIAADLAHQQITPFHRASASAGFSEASSPSRVGSWADLAQTEQPVSAPTSSWWSSCVLAFPAQSWTTPRFRPAYPSHLAAHVRNRTSSAAEPQRRSLQQPGSSQSLVTLALKRCWHEHLAAGGQAGWRERPDLAWQGVSRAHCADRQQRAWRVGDQDSS